MGIKVDPRQGRIFREEKSERFRKQPKHRYIGEESENKGCRPRRSEKGRQNQKHSYFEYEADI